MPKSGPRTVHRYTLEFKLTAVRLSQQPGMQVKTVAAALEIHPFMLSKWRREVRDGTLRGRARAAPPPGPVRELKQFQALEKAHARLQLEHDLLKKPSGSVPRDSRPVCLHCRAARAPLAVHGSAALSVRRGHAQRLLRVAAPDREHACHAGCPFPRGDHAPVHSAPRRVRQSAHASCDDHGRLDRESPPRRPTHAHDGIARESRLRLSRQSGHAPLLRPTSESAPHDPRDRPIKSGSATSPFSRSLASGAISPSSWISIHDACSHGRSDGGAMRASPAPSSHAP
jgi:transposase